jgi:hypothetical protein
MPKPSQKKIPTPPEQVAIVAAILAAGGPTIQPEKDEPRRVMNTMTQRYRQYLRILSRDPDEKEDE